MADINAMNRFVRIHTGLNQKRSQFPLRWDHKTTFNSGVLIPLACEEVIAGDTWQMDVTHLVRQVTPAVPVLDNSYLDIYAFFVPMRLATKKEKDWQHICGENDSGPWVSQTEYTLQNTNNTFALNNRPVETRSIWSYLGLPIGTSRVSPADGSNIDINIMPLKAYLRIWNEWFRDENVMTPINDVTDKNIYYGNGSTDFYLSALKSDSCLPVVKLADRFTSCLPAPQKSVNPVLVPLLGEAPVVTGNLSHDITGNEAMIFADVATGQHAQGNLYAGVGGEVRAASDGSSGGSRAVPANLYADLSKTSGASINQLRLAFALQHLFEIDARGGTRYVEQLKAHFGVAPIDSVLQRPQYLGGSRVFINMNQILQTAPGDNPLGTTGAYSLTTGNKSLIGMQSFNEPGYVMVVACVRTQQTYSQGIPKFLRRNRRFDFYYPVFANLGEQAVMKSEIFSTSDSPLKDSVFGYNEAWSEYRYRPNQVSGDLAPNANDPILGKWTYSLKLSEPPVLNNDFLIQDKGQIDVTLAATASYQFIGDFFFDCKVTRPMPLYSIPGLQGLR